MALRETDIHTGLYTPGFFVAFGARELSFARESGYPVSVISIGIEGHEDENPEGASTLKYLGERVRKEIGEGSIVARVADNQLAVLLPGVTLDRARILAEAIKCLIEDEEHQNPVSIGTASTLDGETEIGELLRASQDELELAKTRM